MRKPNLKLLAGSGESLLAMANFGASSVFWLAAAFFMRSADYGRMMTIQAAIVLVTTLLAFRTHDLVFYLRTRESKSINTAFRLSLGCETATWIISSIIVTSGAFFYFAPSQFGSAVPQVALAGLFLALGTSQGASIAKLRYLKRGDLIARADLMCMMLWTAACLGLLPLRNAAPPVILLLGTFPTAARTVALIHFALLARTDDGTGDAETPIDRDHLRAVARFLIGAQVTNFLKNGAVSIETMILAATLNPTAVGLYRIARSTQGATTAAINVEYQRSYAALARSSSGEERASALALLNKRSLWICLLLYPVSAGFALVFALIKPEVDVIDFQLITLGTFAAFIPAALQQGYFAALSLAGEHRHVNTAYIVSTMLLLIFAAMLIILPSMLLFIAAIICSAMVRLIILKRYARRQLA